MENVRFAEMISKIAHELRSPLTSVKGFSATLLSRWDRFDDEQRYGLVETIHADAERMGRIVSEVLDLARMEAGRLELHKQSVLLGDVVAQAVAQVQTLPGAERIVVDVADELRVLGDPERLLHAFFNVIENAVKFSDDGPIDIVGTVSGDDAVITVRDRGVGIAPDRLDDIFLGPGPTGQSATPRGTGLGLYLTRGLVEAHGGAIGAASTLDEGSTFTITLPLVKA